MILGFLASFIGIAIIISVLAKRSSKERNAQDKNFWDREAQANNVRRKPLDQLNYIHIPLEHFPLQLLEDNITVKECIETLQALSTQKIVNLTGWSNTDLKLYRTGAHTAEMGRCPDRSRLCGQCCRPYGICCQRRNRYQQHILPIGGLLAVPGGKLPDRASDSSRRQPEFCQ